jgi:hypothetical protein
VDIFVFFSLITFQVTILSIVAIVFGQNKIAERAIGSLASVLEKGTLRPSKGTATAENTEATS